MANDNAIPNTEACAVASPKYAILRQTMKHPKGPAASAIPIPANAARIRKLSNIVFFQIIRSM